MTAEEWFKEENIFIRNFEKFFELHQKMLHYKENRVIMKGTKEEKKKYKKMKKEIKKGLLKIKEKIFHLWNAGMNYSEVENYIFQNYPINLATEINCSLLIRWYDDWKLQSGKKETESIFQAT